MLRSTAWSTARFPAASPAFTQTSINPSEGVSVAYAGLSAALPGIPATNPASIRDVRVPPLPAAELPGPAVPLRLSRFRHLRALRAQPGPARLPDTPNDTDPFQLTLDGTPSRTTISTRAQVKADNVTVQARATSTIPGLPVLGDKASKWRPTPDLKVDIRYKF